MKDFLYFLLTYIIFAPAVFLLFSGEFIAEIILCAYAAILWRFVPKKVWRRIIRANLRYTKLLGD